ncbi:unnamed protein product, partial [Rotaria magnacalcarata]
MNIATNKKEMIDGQLTNGRLNTLFRRRLNHFSSVITNRLWLNAHTNYDCDVLLTFPSRV